MVGTKRRRDDDDDDDDGDTENAPVEAHTPSRKRPPLVENATPRSILKRAGVVNGTPRSARKLVFETPTKTPKDDTPNGTPTIVRNADRSARRKSNRRLLERTLNGVDSDDDDEEEEDALAQQILSEQGDDKGDDALTQPVDEPAQEGALVSETPTKRGRGRPKGSGKKGRPPKQASPSLPAELPPHEEYFYQNRPGGAKTSNNTLSAQSLLNHDEYFQAMQSWQQPHAVEMDFLLELHARAYDQWIFELDQGFNICLYGYGSKRSVTERFTAHLYHHLLEQQSYRRTKKTPKIVVVNGYSAGTTIKDILSTVAAAAVPAHTKTPNQPTALLDFLLDHLSTTPPPHPIPIVLNSIDSPYLRKSPSPSLLARLAAHPSINLVCTADTPNFPLLWDIGLKTQYKFLFHDTTTFAPFDTEIDAVESVNELLGRSGRRIGGRDGVGFVLRSLPENARSLFRILVMEQLALSLMESGLGEADEVVVPKSKKKVAPAKTASVEAAQGVEYRVLYHKAVGEFVCSSEVGFRTLLKEFHDHQMIESRKDALGTERLWVPFRQEELEGLAEDLAADGL